MKFRERNVKAPTLRYRLDDLVIDTGARRVTRNGIDLGISGLSFDLLLTLGRAAPNLLSTDRLIDTVWTGQVVSTETVTQRVKLLRRQLEDDATKPRYVASRRGYGYRLVSRMTPLRVEITAAGIYSQANELLLQARAIMRGTHESWARALKLVDQALSHAPEFAPALAHRAVLVASSVLLNGAARERLAAAEQDATRALEVDPQLVDAHVALGIVYATRLAWLDADRCFGAALALSPTDVFVRNLYVLIVLRPTGRLTSARKELEETYEINPAAGFTAHELALTHSLLGDDAAALRFLDLAHALSGIGYLHWDLMLVRARASARSGRFSEAVEHALKALPAALQREGGAPVLNAFYAALGDPSRNKRARFELAALLPRLHAPGVDGRTRAFFVTALVAVGSIDRAFETIEECLGSASAAALNIELSELWLPEMRVFRRDRRFHFLTKRLALDEYWKRCGEQPPEWPEDAGSARERAV
jgi:DNA-binding winged helix-turn-helix (wHTH) protein